jgi:hypothetical protein
MAHESVTASAEGEFLDQLLRECDTRVAGQTEMPMIPVSLAQIHRGQVFAQLRMARQTKSQLLVSGCVMPPGMPLSTATE